MPDMKLLVAIFALLTVLDIVQTYYFPRFGLKEGNPFLAKLMSQYGFDVLFLVKYVIFASIFIASAEGWIGNEVYVALAIQSFVVLWNFYKIKKGSK